MSEEIINIDLLKKQAKAGNLIALQKLREKGFFKSNRATATSFDVILPLQKNGSRPPLFCIHPRGGLSWGYGRLTLPDNPVYGLQARGITQPKSLPSSLDAMAADYAVQIRLIQSSGPYNLLGWSIGGNLAYTIATQLQQQGHEIATLALLDSHVPNNSLQADLSTFADLEETALKNNIQQWSGILSINTIIRISKAEAHTVHIARSFTPKQYQGDIVFFSSTDNISTPIPPWHIWQNYINGNIEIHHIPYNHNDLMNTPSAALISSILVKKIA
jgi:thioesterase domain-containing protein